MRGARMFLRLHYRKTYLRFGWLGPDMATKKRVHIYHRKNDPPPSPLFLSLSLRYYILPRFTRKPFCFSTNLLFWRPSGLDQLFGAVFGWSLIFSIESLTDRKTYTIERKRQRKVRCDSTENFFVNSKHFRRFSLFCFRTQANECRGVWLIKSRQLRIAFHRASFAFPIDNYGRNHSFPRLEGRDAKVKENNLERVRRAVRPCSNNFHSSI